VSPSRPPRLPRRLRAGLAVVAAALTLAACAEVPSNLVEHQPYKVEAIEGTDLNRVTLADETAAKIDLQTASVRQDGRRKVVPHASLIYNPDGDVFVYTKPRSRTYVRAPVEVAHIADDRAVLSAGPRAGTVIVTVGAAELLATEYEILNQHP
jgi:ferric-dicitrate binding protein FerR (iron transport regulator)